MIPLAFYLFITLVCTIKTTSAVAERYERSLAELISLANNLGTLSNTNDNIAVIGELVKLIVELNGLKLNEVLAELIGLIPIPKEVTGVTQQLAGIMDELKVVLMNLAMPSIGYTATVEGRRQAVRRHDVLPFSKMIDSDGSGFNTSDGIFYCPQSGFYQFSSSIDVKKSGCLFDFKKNDITVGNLYKGNYNGWGTTSATIHLRLMQGDRVWVQNNGTCRRIKVNTGATLFSGILVSV